MKSINRMAVVIKPKQPFIDWINSMPGEDCNYTLENLSKENLVFLIPEQNTPEEALKYIRKNCSIIFEWELWGWITDEKYWIQNRNWKTFNEWFEIEINSEVFDLVPAPIEREDA